nr:hypothetical protein [Rubrobacter indicoceani]
MKPGANDPGREILGEASGSGRPGGGGLRQDHHQGRVVKVGDLALAVYCEERVFYPLDERPDPLAL